MIIDIKKMALIVILATAVFLPYSFADTNGLIETLSKMPAQNSAMEGELCSKLLIGGAGQIKQICEMIVPPGTGDDTKARYAISSLVSYTSRPDADLEKKILSTVLNAALEKASNKEVKSFFITQLQFVGDDDSVPFLSKYLADARLCEPASFTLQTIGTDAAKKTVLKALPTASKETLPTIIYALGQMQVKDAAEGIAKHAGSNDRTLRLVTLDSLAEIGDVSSVEVFEKAFKVKDPYERGVVASNYVNLAKRLQETGSSDEAVRICKNILQSKDEAVKSSMKAAALSIIVDALGNDAADYIEDAFDAGNGQLQDAAMKLLAKINDPSISKIWSEKTRKASAEEKIKIFNMLASRDSDKSIDYLIDSFNDSDNDMRIEIVKAMMAGNKTPKTGCATYLLDIIRSGSNDPAHIQAAKSLILQIPTRDFESFIPVMLPKTDTAGQVAMIEILAERRVTKHIDTVFSLTASKDSSVSVAATKALGYLGGPEDIGRLIELMLYTNNSAQRSAASRSVIQICGDIEDGSVATKPLLAAMDGATVDQQISIINLLSSVGTKQALDIVVSKTNSKDAKLKDAAIRTLTKWKTVDALDALIDIAESTSQLNYQVITFRAYVTLTAKSDLPASQKAANFRNALKTAKRTDEKKFTVSRLAQVQSVETLALAVDLLDDKELSADAARGVAKIALPDGRKFKGLKGPQVGELLRKAYGKIEDEKLREKLDAYIKKFPVKKNVVNNSAGQIKPPQGFVALFNGKDLAGWKGLMAKPYDNPIKRAKLDEKGYAAQQAISNVLMRKHWKVVDGVLFFDGKGHSLATEKDYGDFEMLVDWKLMHANGDSGIYLRGSPQVQIWDPAHHNNIGSGGLYNNKKNPSKPLVTADNPIGQWNTFRIKMVGEKVTVHLNGKLVVDNVTMENYWDRNKSIFPREQIELQCHGNPVCFRNIFIRQIDRSDEFNSLFNGRDLSGWIGDTKGYIVEDGTITCKPGGNLYTEGQYSDFVLRFKFQLTDGANNGLGIRTRPGVNAAYDGMEIQILDNTAGKYSNLKKYQYHGSIYGVVPANYGEIPATQGGYLKPVGQWNTEEVIARGNHIKVILNGKPIVDADIKKASKKGTMDNRPHPGLFNKTGHIGFLGHGSVVKFKDIEIKELK